MKSDRYKKLFKQNSDLEKDAPYNFCDRWCERCSHKVQGRCKLYQDEFEQRITCIAHGRDEDDPQITEDIMKQQYEETEDTIKDFMDEYDFELEEMAEYATEEVDQTEQLIKSDPLIQTAQKYRKIAQLFLDNSFFNDDDLPAKVVYDFETIAWYHTLLPVKLQRALCGFEEMDEDEFGIGDAVAQFIICQTAIKKSIEAFRRLGILVKNERKVIIQMIALLHNIGSRIELMERKI